VLDREAEFALPRFKGLTEFKSNRHIPAATAGLTLRPPNSRESGQVTFVSYAVSSMVPLTLAGSPHPLLYAGVIAAASVQSAISRR